MLVASSHAAPVQTVLSMLLHIRSPATLFPALGIPTKSTARCPLLQNRVFSYRLCGLQCSAAKKNKVTRQQTDHRRTKSPVRDKRLAPSQPLPPTVEFRAQPIHSMLQPGQVIMSAADMAQPERASLSMIQNMMLLAKQLKLPVSYKVRLRRLLQHSTLVAAAPCHGLELACMVLCAVQPKWCIVCMHAAHCMRVRMSILAQGHG